jgi:hypothetical protein
VCGGLVVGRPFGGGVRLVIPCLLRGWRFCGVVVVLVVALFYICGWIWVVG